MSYQKPGTGLSAARQRAEAIARETHRELQFRDLRGEVAAKRKAAQLSAMQAVHAASLKKEGSE